MTNNSKKTNSPTSPKYNKQINFKAQFIIILLFVSFFSTSTLAMDVTLQWDANSDADYYVVYYGTSPGSYTQNSADIPAPAIQYTAAGLSETTWYFSVKAFNNCGNSSDFSDEISHSPAQSPGLAASIFSPAQNTTITAGQSVDFQGTISGGLPPYDVLWTFGTGGPADNINEDPRDVVFQNPGSYSVVFKVTDSNNLTINSTVNVTVNALVVESDPIASIASPMSNVTITEGGSVNFQGSVDGGNAPFTHSWNFGAGGPLSSTVEDPGSISFPNAGTYLVTYTVRDNDTGISSATITVTVEKVYVNLTPVVSIESPTSNVTITEGSSVNFQGSVTSGNAPFTHKWTFGGGGPSNSTKEDPGSMSFQNAGDYIVTYTVTDSDNEIISASVAVTVEKVFVDLSPTASIDSPSSSLTITEGDSVDFHGRVASGNAPFTHTWDFGTGGPADQVVEDPGSITFPTAGTFNVTYTVRDADGDASSTNLNITVKQSVVDTIPAVSILSPSSDVTIAPGDSVVFQGDVTGGNAPLAYSWTFGNGGPASSSSEDPGSIAFTSVGVYTITFIARDTDNDNNSASLTVTVEQPVVEETPQPSPIYPSDETGISLTPELEADVQNYEGETWWQISVDANFSSLVLDVKKSKGISSLKVPKMVLSKSTNYYWRVKQTNTKSLPSDWSAQTTFRTTDTEEGIVDEDGNGISDDQDVESGVDINNDGISDVEQDEIKSVHTLTGNTIVGIMRDQNVVAIEQMESIDHNTIDETLNRPDSMPSGLIGFRIVVAEPGDTAFITVCFADPAPENAAWYKYDSISGWQNYSAYTTFSNDRKQLYVEITDGGIGDADGVANGVIVDPAGLGIMNENTVPNNSIINSEEGGGCFIGSTKDASAPLPFGMIPFYFLSIIGFVIAIRLFGKRLAK